MLKGNQVADARLRSNNDETKQLVSSLGCQLKRQHNSLPHREKLSLGDSRMALKAVQYQISLYLASAIGLIERVID
jgi:hypothetical protein